MNNNSRMLFRILAGGYLTYLGIKLVRSTFSGNTDNPVMYGGFGIAFMIIGIGYIIFSVKRNKDAENMEDDIENDVEDESECPVEETRGQLEEKNDKEA